jgi:hypothetical protein
MKKTLLFLTALLFNVIVGGAIAAASGFNPLAVIGTGTVLSFGVPHVSGALPMAVQKEIWMNSIIEGLFADNSFLNKAFNADAFVSNKTVHIPNAGSPSNVVRNRTILPATVKHRDDVDLTFDLDEFTTDPIRIPNADNYELTYNKRESVLGQDKRKLMDEIAKEFIYKWSPSSTYVTRTTGDAVAPYLTGQTGNRKKFVVDDVEALMAAFNDDDIPQENRNLLIDAQMYRQLINSMSEADSRAFHALADLKRGVVGKLLSFDIMMRSRVAKYTSGVVAKRWSTTAAATDQAAGLAWHNDSVCRALGQTEMFDEESSPTYYGDIYSFLVRAGGRPMRNDVKGLKAIVQANA